MFVRLSPWVALAVLGACGSGDDSDAFLPLDEVCAAYAEDVCGAQEPCCDAPADADCVKRVRAACEPQRDRLTMEADLSYEGEHANRQRDALRAGLDDCRAPAPVASFFSGGAAQGAACERDAQCASFACREGKCAAPAALPLCDF
jgi:hypothetical protein